MGKNIANIDQTFLFCDGGSCQKKGSEKAIRAARAFLRNNGFWDTCHTIKTRCNGRCEDAPTCIVPKGNYWYKELTPEKTVHILRSHIENNEPVEADLLYAEGWDKVKSNQERKEIKPKELTLVENDILGQCWWTKGFSSEQYLHPLFMYIKEHSVEGMFSSADGKEWDLKSLTNIVYDLPYEMELFFENQSKVSLTIGIIPKTPTEEITKHKITSTEYFFAVNSDALMLLFKNKKGEKVAEIQITSKQESFKNYCLKEMLRGISIPQVEILK